jgi:hypothetical protein
MLSEEYYFVVENKKFIKDEIQNAWLLVENEVEVGGLPSHGDDFTLFYVNNGDIYHAANFMTRQVQPAVINPIPMKVSAQDTTKK